MNTSSPARICVNPIAATPGTQCSLVRMPIETICIPVRKKRSLQFMRGRCEDRHIMSRNKPRKPASELTFDENGSSSTRCDPSAYDTRNFLRGALTRRSTSATSAGIHASPPPTPPPSSPQQLITSSRKSASLFMPKLRLAWCSMKSFSDTCCPARQACRNEWFDGRRRGRV